MDDTVFDELKNDHNTQRTLMRLMLKTKEGSKGRKELFARLRKHLEAHASAEDRVFYSPLLADAVGRRHAAHSIGEHEEIRDMLESLAQTDPASPEWIKRAEALVRANKHHIDEEEQKVFPIARQVLSRAEVTEMSQEFPDVRLEEKAS